MAFELPTGYSCIVPASTTSQTTIYAYNRRIRDRFDLIGFDWVKTQTTSYSYDQDLSSLLCLTQEKLVPTDVGVHFVLPAVILVLAFFSVVMKMFMGVRR